MTITYTINHWNIEGNRRVNYGRFTMTSGETAVRSMNTGLRMIETLEAETRTSGNVVRVTLPSTWPEANNVSGVVTLEFTSTAVIFWKAKGKV